MVARLGHSSKFFPLDGVSAQYLHKCAKLFGSVQQKACVPGSRNGNLWPRVHGKPAVVL